MKTNLFILAALLMLGANAYGQQTNPWAKWSWMFGDWKVAGTGTPGAGLSMFSFEPGHNNSVLMRRSHSKYPPAKDKPEVIHEDLMIIYLDSGEPSRAIYFDNKGQTINYSITYSADSIVMQADKVTNRPVFRLTYTRIDNKTANVKYEMSTDGEKFITYDEGRCTKMAELTRGR